MLESIKVSNFQSLHDIEVEFGKFTVIVGASSSGKSALTRAIRAVTSNALDSDNITRGTKVSAISVKSDDTTITIQREQGGSSAYKVIQVGSQESSFTKLNRQVPSEVTKALGISPDTKEVTSINFAGQFDTPYLLKEGASSVARVLGELTNVSTIFSAVREASKRAKNASAIVNLRKKDQAALLANFSQYAAVAVQAKSVSEAEQQLAKCLDLQTQIEELSSLADQLARALKTLETIKEIPEVPSIGSLEEAARNLSTFKDLVRQLVLAKKQIVECESSITEVDSAIMLAEDELHQTLVQAGQCPTCNQKVS